MSNETEYQKRINNTRWKYDKKMDKMIKIDKSRDKND